MFEVMRMRSPTPPNQVFIGNLHPDALRDISQPWYEHPVPGAKRQGKFGEIFPEDEFYGWMKVADDFDLIWLTPEFIQTVRQKLASSPFANEVQLKKLGPGKGWQAKPISPRFFMGKNGTPLT